MSWWSPPPQQQGAGWHSWRPPGQWTPQGQGPPALDYERRSAPGDGARHRRRDLVMNFLKSRHTEMLKEYDATHEEGQDDFDVCAWCVAHCSTESYAEHANPKNSKKNLTPAEVNQVRQAILHHYFATIVCGHSFRRHVSIV
jgi:hypothetical protein